MGVKLERVFETTKQIEEYFILNILHNKFA